MKTKEEYLNLISENDKRVEKLKEQLKTENETLEKLGDEMSKRETTKHLSDFALTRAKDVKAWLILMIIAAAMDIYSVIVSIYWMKDPAINTFWQGFKHNGEPLILVIVSIVLWIIALIILFSNLKKRKKLSGEVDEWNGNFEKAEKAYNEQKTKRDDLTSEIARINSETAKVRDEYYKAYPDVAKEAYDAKEAERQAAINELRHIEEVNLKAAEDAKKKANDKMEGQKMFEHPQAYILDGLFDNEYDVFVKAADMGCEDAQDRVIRLLLGMAYKNGVKVDVAKGEECALRYASDGNTAMYELLGRGFLYGEGEITKNEEKGLSYLEKASSKGRQNAMIMAGICYYNGVGTEKDDEKARNFFAKAAKQGNAQAIQVVAAMDNGQKLHF